MIELMHLIWAPLGTGPFARFVESYSRLSAGVDHHLALVFHGFDGQVDSGPWDELASGVRHRRVETPGPALDLDVYRHVAVGSDARRLCLTNSYTEILAAGWLAALDAALDAPGVGAAGVGGSWESAYSSAPIWLKPWRRRRFAPFPNPHLRTNGLMMDRSTMLDLDWPDTGMSKLAALELESGRRGIAAQLAERGLASVVVGRDGRSYHFDDWPTSGAFRSGSQGNLLVADNRTEQYRDADAVRRRELADMAWGVDPLRR